MPRVKSRRIVGIRAKKSVKIQEPKANIRKVKSQSSSGLSQDQKNAIYAIIAIVAIVLFVMMANGRGRNVGGEAVRPPSYDNCQNYWSGYCLKYECASGTQACSDSCAEKVVRRCQPSRV